MPLPPTARERWVTASIVRHLAAQLPEIDVLLGPLTTQPATLPALVLHLEETARSAYLGQGVTAIAGQQGAGLEIQYWIALLASPQEYATTAGALLDRLRVVLRAGQCAWVSEETPGIVLNHGAIGLVLDEGGAHPAAESDQPQLTAAGWGTRVAKLTARATLEWPQGVTP